MHVPDYFYRRRFVREQGLRHVFHDYGPALVWRDDDDYWGYDFCLAESAPTGSMPGLDLAGQPGVIAPAQSEWRYGRLWAWRSRPLASFAMYGPDGTLVGTRIDFATPLAEHGGARYQTDLYLDVFISADRAQILIADQDELEEARGSGLISHEQHQLVLAQQRELVDILYDGTFDSWLGPQPVFDPALLPPYRGSVGRYIQPGQPDGWPKELGEWP